MSEYQRLVQRASRIWTECWSTAKSEEAAVSAAIERAKEEQSPDLTYDMSCGAWANDGFPTLTCGQLTAAALMATDYASFDSPFRVWAVQVPRGLLTYGGADPDVLLWDVVSRGDETHLRMRILTGRAIHRRHAYDIREGEIRMRFEDAPDVDGDGRCEQLLERLTAGLLHLYRAETSDGARQQLRPTRRGETHRDGPPRHRIAFLGRGINVKDMRPWVASYLAEGRAAPSFQAVVRGHYKQQAFGVGRSGRKVIWVAPYWRGPEDAPILARPYKV